MRDVSREQWAAPEGAAWRHSIGVSEREAPSALLRHVAKLFLMTKIERRAMAQSIWYRAIRPLLRRHYPDAILAALGTDEQFESKLWTDRIHEGDVVIDVGANVGYYTILAAKRVGRHGRVVAFEPEPSNFAILQGNVTAFRFENVVLERKAVTSRTIKTRLYLSPRAKGDHRSYDPHDGRESVEIDGVALDDYFRGFERPIAAIKIDIQGAEMDAVLGMKALLDRSPGVLLFTEFWPEGLRTCGADPAAYIDFFVDRGFEVLNIDEKSGRLIPVARGALPAALLGAYTNLLCGRSPLG
jgi:FkbM family methyltransferase